jgi:hypothetical protein
VLVWNLLTVDAPSLCVGDGEVTQLRMGEVLTASNIAHLVRVQFSAFGIAVAPAENVDLTIASIGSPHHYVTFVWHIGILRSIELVSRYVSRGTVLTNASLSWRAS